MGVGDHGCANLFNNIIEFQEEKANKTMRQQENAFFVHFLFLIIPSVIGGLAMPIKIKIQPLMMKLVS